MMRRAGYVVAALTGLAILFAWLYLHLSGTRDSHKAESGRAVTGNDPGVRVVEATRYARDWRTQLGQLNAIILAEKIPDSWSSLLERALVVEPSDTEWGKAASDKDAVWIDEIVANRIDPGIWRNLLKEGKYLYFYGKGATTEAGSESIGLGLPFREECDARYQQIG